MSIYSNRYVILLFACFSSSIYAAPRPHLCEAGASLCTLPINFDVVAINTISAAKTVILSNTGDAPLTVKNMEIAGEFSLGATYACYNKGSSCAKPALPVTTIAPGEGFTFNIWYAPVSNPGTGQSVRFSNIGALKFTTDADMPEISIPLVGTTDTRECLASPAPTQPFPSTALGIISTAVDIPIAPTSTERTFEIYTTGEFSQTNNCGDKLAANKPCTITATFAPSVTSTRYGQLYLNRNARSCGLPDYTLKGEATGTNLNEPAPAKTAVNPVAPTKADDGSSGDKTTDIKGCSMGKGSVFDPVLALLVLAAVMRLSRKRMPE